MSAAALPVPPPIAAPAAPPPVVPSLARPPIRPVPQASPKPLRWTCDLFHAVCDAGLLEGRNVILVNGEVLEMAAPNPPHATAVGLLDYWLKAAFAPGHWVRVQGGIVFGLGTDPVPDLAVVVGGPRDYPVHPRTAVLIAEVADSSVAYDTGDKANLYAAAGIADYWVVDVTDPRVVVHRGPQPDPGVPFGARYTRVTEHRPPDAVAPLARPAASVPVADLLP